MGGNVAARPLDVARFVYQTYSPHGKLLKHSSQAMMVDYHPLTQGFGTGFLSYGLGTIGMASSGNFSFCDGLQLIGHPGQDFGSGAPWNFYVTGLDFAINIAMTSSHDSTTCGMQCGLTYGMLTSGADIANKGTIGGIIAEALGREGCAGTAKDPLPAPSTWPKTGRRLVPGPTHYMPPVMPPPPPPPSPPTPCRAAGRTALGWCDGSTQMLFKMNWPDGSCPADNIGLCCQGTRRSWMSTSGRREWSSKSAGTCATNPPPYRCFCPRGRHQWDVHPTGLSASAGQWR